MAVRNQLTDVGMRGELVGVLVVTLKSVDVCRRDILYSVHLPWSGSVSTLSCHPLKWEVQKLSLILCANTSPFIPQITCYRAVSGVFRTIDLHTPSPLSECVLPPHQRRKGTHYSPGGEGVGLLGDQYFGRRQTLDWLDWPFTV
jgi:hypothetical protein